MSIFSTVEKSVAAAAPNVESAISTFLSTAVFTSLDGALQNINANIMVLGVPVNVQGTLCFSVVKPAAPATPAAK